MIDDADTQLARGPDCTDMDKGQRGGGGDQLNRAATRDVASTWSTFLYLLA